MPKTIACIYIIISMIIGAGMLAIPLISSKIGFLYATLLLCGMWVVLFYSSTLVLELALILPQYRNNFNSMAKVTLGTVGQLVINGASLLLLYSIVGAYIAGGSSLLTGMLHSAFHFKIPGSLSAIIFTLIFGYFIFLSTRAVDYSLRIFMSLKGVLLLITLALLMPHVDLHFLAATRNEHLLVFVLPIYIITLAYSNIIPSLINYVGKNPKILLRSIAIGSVIPLLLFLFWLAISLGIIPYEGAYSFTAIEHAHQSLDGLMQAFHHRIEQPVLYIMVDLFSNIALIASFLAVGLTLFDFMADACNRKNDNLGRLQTAFIAFLPPMIFASIYPQGFIYALNISALSVCILHIILPPLMVYRLRKNENGRQVFAEKYGVDVTTIYKAPGGNLILMMQIGIGIGLLILCIITSFHLVSLPSGFG